jgi:hypothetical protein
LLRFPNRDHHICRAMTTSLTDTDGADLARFLREAIEADRYPLSPRVRRLKELLAQVDPAPAVTPNPALKPIGEPSHLLAKRRGRRR